MTDADTRDTRDIREGLSQQTLDRRYGEFCPYCDARHHGPHWANGAPREAPKPEVA